MDYLEELNPKQKEAVDALDGVVMISAGAGSGKTKVLTCRIARLIQKDLSNIFQTETRQMRGVLVSVSAVRISSDLSVAKAYLSI